jgi:hypothetical protein
MSGKARTADGKRWRRWTEAEARAVLEELSGWGGSLVDFARSKGVSTHRLAYWRKRLPEARPPAFVSVALPGDTSAPRTGIEILVGGVVVRVPDELDAERVASIVQALAQRLGC